MQLITTFFKKKTMASLVKFGITGTVGLVIDFSITWLLRDILLVNGYFANGCGFVVAAASNYYINSRWTFKTDTTSRARQFALFFIISLIGLGLNTGFLYVFQELGVSFYISKALAIGFVFIWNFIANSLITFRAGKSIIINNTTISASIKP
jgi:putative flippase GtrA